MNIRYGIQAVQTILGQKKGVFPDRQNRGDLSCEQQ